MCERFQKERASWWRDEPYTTRTRGGKFFRGVHTQRNPSTNIKFVMPGQMEREGKIIPPAEPPPPGPAEPAKPPMREPEQGPPVRDPVRKKGPVGDPEPAEPPRRDPPPAPPAPGEPSPTIKDPLAPGQPEKPIIAISIVDEMVYSTNRRACPSTRGPSLVPVGVGCQPRATRASSNSSAVGW